METGIRSLTSTDLNVTTSTNQETLGAVGVTADGRKFRYVQSDAVAGLGAGLIGVAPAQDPNTIGCSLSATSLEAVGTQVVTVDVGGAVATDQLAGGYLVVRSGAGEGAAYRINGNTQTAGAGACQVTLFDAVSIALDSATTVVDLVNTFSGVIASTTAGVPVGAAQVDFAPGYYGWVQTSGFAAVLNDGGWVAGDSLEQSTGVAGALASSGGWEVAVALDAGVDTEYSTVNLAIA
jgi:hypothetical protein